MLMKMVGEYCQCVDDIPSAIPDILTRLVELLKVNMMKNILSFGMYIIWTRK